MAQTDHRYETPRAADRYGERYGAENSGGFLRWLLPLLALGLLGWLLFSFLNRPHERVTTPNQQRPAATAPQNPAPSQRTMPQNPAPQQSMPQTAPQQNTAPQPNTAPQTP